MPFRKRVVVTLRGMVKSGDVDMNFGLNILSPRRLLPLLVSACLSAGATAPGRAAAATVNPHAVLVNSFAGWGTSLCWWAHVVGGYSNREEFAQMAFVKLGLNIVRYNIGGGENPALPDSMQPRARVPGFEPSPGKWDWSADANQRWMLRRAMELGANRVEAFANSPPWWMTASGSVTGSTNGTANNLLPQYEDAFAEYLVNTVSHLTALDHVYFDYLSPVNEPTSGWWKYGGHQEGCHIGPAQQARLVRLIHKYLVAAGMTNGIIASEDNSERETCNSLHAYPAADLNLVSLVATHSYNANAPDELRLLARNRYKPLWVSEYGDADASGLTMARRIQSDLTVMRAQAWVYWQVVDGTGGWTMIKNRENGDARHEPGEKFYVRWQFSHFIRPGCQLIGVNESHSLAAYDAAGQKLTVVAVNDGTNALKVVYHLAAFAQTGTAVSVTRTSKTEPGVSLADIALEGKGFTASLPAGSVTTFVIPNTSVAAAGQD